MRYKPAFDAGRLPQRGNSSVEKTSERPSPSGATRWGFGLLVKSRFLPMGRPAGAFIQLLIIHYSLFTAQQASASNSSSSLCHKISSADTG